MWNILHITLCSVSHGRRDTEYKACALCPWTPMTLAYFPSYPGLSPLFDTGLSPLSYTGLSPFSYTSLFPLSYTGLSSLLTLACLLSLTMACLLCLTLAYPSLHCRWRTLPTLALRRLSGGVVGWPVTDNRREGGELVRVTAKRVMRWLRYE